MTNDIDAIYNASIDMKEAINKVGDDFGFNNGWLNDDFIMTKSYSDKLIEYSKFYKTFDHILDVRTIDKEYLIAMKLMSFRKYKNDISDIIGIIFNEKDKGNNIELNDIKKALVNLYGSNYKLSKEAKTFMSEVLKEKNLKELYYSHKNNEKLIKQKLINFNNDVPINENNIDEIINLIEKK